MKNKIKLFAFISLVIFSVLSSCTKEEFKPYDNPFFHIMVNNNSQIEVLHERKDTVDYKVYLSAPLQFEPIDVQYEIKIGNGLQSGRDFKILTTGSTLTFPQGIFERPIKIAWFESTLDPEKDNKITITLISNSKNFIMGLPGPDQFQRQLVITKK